MNSHVQRFLSKTLLMSVLSRTEILAAIESGDIKIDPFDPNSVSCASIDLTLSNEFRRYKPAGRASLCLPHSKLAS